MTPANTPAPRLFALLARESRRAVVFRRGPARQVQLVGWDRSDDSFTPGQWFKGRIYERRSDLSPSGALLVCFTARHHGPDMNATVICRPPWLTALARWPVDHSWGGGGLFAEEGTLWLAHSPQMDPQVYEHAREVARASGLAIIPLEAVAGRARPEKGWDMQEPVDALRRRRDGWRPAQPGGVLPEHDGSGLRFDPPQIWEKTGPDGWRLQELRHGASRAGKPSSDLEFRLIDDAGRVLGALGAADWADWDGGDLVYARGGCLYRLAAGLSDPSAARLLHDFRGSSFTPMNSPLEARRW